MTVPSKTLSILICGDYAPIGRFEEAARLSDPALFGDLADYICDSDVACLNLEVPLVSVLSPEMKVGPVLNASPETLNSVVAAGFDTVTLANNHILDHGQSGLLSTLEACERTGLATVGAGVNCTAANQPLIVERNGIRLGILSFAEQEFNAAGSLTGGAAILDPVTNMASILDAKDACDALVLILHCGNEFFNLPRPGLRDLCHLYARVGADAIVCHHPHVPGAWEEVGGVPIHYSLGNLVFDRKDPPKGWNDGYAVRLTVEVDCARNVRISQQLFPYEQEPENHRLNLLKGTKQKLFAQQMNERNQTLQNSASYDLCWTKFCDSVCDNMLSKLTMPRNFRGSERLFRALGLKSLFFSRRAACQKMNLLRCPSHRDVLIKIMEKI